MREKHLIIIFSSLLYFNTQAQLSEYEQGDNLDFKMGLDLASTLQVNPKSVGGENQVNLGYLIDLNYVKYDFKKIFENRFLIDFSAQKTGEENFKKNTDRFEYTLKYAFKQSYLSKIFYAADFTLRTQLLSSFEDNYLVDSLNTRDKITEFLSPSNMTVSIGLEHRPYDNATYFYFSPIALNSLYVADNTLAKTNAFDNNGNILGTLHGNIAGTKFKNRIGSQIKVRYELLAYEERINWDTHIDMFVAYQEFKSDLLGFSPIQIEWVSSFTFRIWKSLLLSLDTRLTYDPDLLFLDQKSSSGQNSYRDDIEMNITNRILLAFSHRFSKKSDL